MQRAMLGQHIVDRLKYAPSFGAILRRVPCARVILVVKGHLCADQPERHADSPGGHVVGQTAKAGACPKAERFTSYPEASGSAYRLTAGALRPILRIDLKKG